MELRKLFVIIVKYIVNIEEVEKYLTMHLEYLQECYSKDVFLASGRQVPRFGGIIIAKAKNRQEIYTILSEDPFHKNTCAEYQVHEFEVTKASLAFNSFLQESKLVG